MPDISYITANLVARPVGFEMRQGWMQGDNATNDLFRPIEHFRPRFEEMITGIQELGFTSIDLWCAHLHPAWATARHLETARAILKAHSIRVTSLACHWGNSPDDLRAIAIVLHSLNTDLISGNHGLLNSDRPALARELRNLGLRLAYENHPEKSATEILARIGDDHPDVLGVAFDTGWAGTGGFDAPSAARELLPRLLHIHAKDVRPRRTEKSGFPMIDMGHETCTLGDGIVAVESTLRNVVAAGFSGPIGIEHEPEHHNPANEIRTSLERVRTWLA
jgi:sugar phosphate isomerase/epimerase